MQVDVKRLRRVGVDRVVLNNLKITNFEELEKETRMTKNHELIEKVEHVEYGVMSLTYTRNQNERGESYHYSTLEFNPGKLGRGHNLYSASNEELMEGLAVVLERLKSVGIEIDASEAKIKEIELASTIVADFEALQEVVLLIGRANFKKALVISSFKETDIPQQIKRDRSLYLNSKTNDLKKPTTGKVIKIYDKTFEAYLNHGLSIDKKLTRVELVLGQDYFRTAMAREGLDNTLQAFCNSNVAETLFQKGTVTELVDRPSKYFETIRQRLSEEFVNFRRNETVKRQERKKLKEQGKEIPEHYKEERGVFKHLQETAWIFDFSFLLEIVQAKVSSRHRSVYEQQILKKHIKTTNLSLYYHLLVSVYGENFFASYSNLVGGAKQCPNAEIAGDRA